MLRNSRLTSPASADPDRGVCFRGGESGRCRGAWESEFDVFWLLITLDGGRVLRGGMRIGGGVLAICCRSTSVGDGGKRRGGPSVSSVARRAAGRRASGGKRSESNAGSWGVSVCFFLVRLCADGRSKTGGRGRARYLWAAGRRAALHPSWRLLRG